MGFLDDALAEDAAIFVDLDGFGEEVTYTPRVGDAREINAQVQREVRETDEDYQGSLVPSIIVEVRNSATLGISSDEVNTGGDKITLAERIGGTARAMLITEVLSQDAGIMRLRLGVSR